MSTSAAYAPQNFSLKKKSPRAFLGPKTAMKPTMKQRFFNWLSSNDSHYIPVPDRAIEADSLASNGLRFNLYKAHGGYVIETRGYDDRNDRSINKMYVITEDQDLGESLGKIITTESMR